MDHQALLVSQMTCSVSQLALVNPSAPASPWRIPCRPIRRRRPLATPHLDQLVAAPSPTVVTQKRLITPVVEMRIAYPRMAARVENSNKYREDRKSTRLNSSH